MARKFLYLIAFLIVLAIASLFALRLFSTELAEFALVPDQAFEEQKSLSESAYADPAMWYVRPGDPGETLARWLPDAATDDRELLPSPVAPAPEKVPPFAVFFIHPTSYLNSAEWNAPLDDEESQRVARLFVRGMASPFAAADSIWAPRYRQATFGSFLTAAPEASQAKEVAYADVEQAFDQFLNAVPEGQAIVLAGHSQGALHVIDLLRKKIADTPIRARIAAAYAVGWPISVEHDLPALGLPACGGPDQPGCVMSWLSYAEPFEVDRSIEIYRQSMGFDGELRGDSPVLCTNPLTGGAGGAAGINYNLGTMVPNDALDGGELVQQAVSGRCNDQGLLLIGDPPQMGPFVLPGNDYHVYDIPLFWANLRADVGRRVIAWQTAR